MKVYYYSNPNKPKLTDEQRAAKKEERKTVLEVVKEQQATEEKRSLLKQTQSYLKAEATHAWGGPAPEDEIKKRIEICMACPGRVETLSGQSDSGGIGFCTKCGCPASQRSQLSVKLTLAGVPCPLGKFSTVEGTGGTIASAVEAAKGIFSSITSQIGKAFK